MKTHQVDPESGHPAELHVNKQNCRAVVNIVQRKYRVSVHQLQALAQKMMSHKHFGTSKVCAWWVSLTRKWRIASIILHFLVRDPPSTQLWQSNWDLFMQSIMTLTLNSKACNGIMPLLQAPWCSRFSTCALMLAVYYWLTDERENTGVYHASLLRKLRFAIKDKFRRKLTMITLAFACQ